ncbi:MAG TPA: lamin tail domain-containing protein, partial [Phycisphaerales bacterium]|nr:lamin tail domain-containing protein [Phycisphaerales bacterium]
MRKSIGIACLLAASAGAAHGQIVISQVYGSGGSASAAYTNDYVELFNPTAGPISVTGWSIQYASAAGTSWQRTNLSGSIPAGGYYLVQLASNGANGAALPTPDATGTTNISGTSGKLALRKDQVTITGTGCVTPDSLTSDFVGYGTANCSEGGAAAPSPSLANAIFRGNDGCSDTDNNGADFAAAAAAARNSASPLDPCGGGCTDCNNNTTCDVDEINANGGVGGVGGSLDCDSNGQLDSCQLSSGTDCDANGTLDACQIAGNPALDCNANGTLDFCEINAAGGIGGVGGRFDACNNNGLLDSCEAPAPGQDCNANSVIDCWDFKVGTLTDVDANGTADVCEGAIVVETPLNATVQVNGVRPTTNGEFFFNIQGVNAGTNASYGALRFDNSVFGVANPDRVYLFLQQHNSAFTSGGFPGDPDNVEIFHTNNDTIDISVPVFPATNPNAVFGNFASDYADRLSADAYLFQRGLNDGLFGDATGSGTTESYLLFDADAPTPAGQAIAADIASGSGSLTLVLNPLNDTVAATYAGMTNNRYRGPSLVIFPGIGGCDSIDFNGDGLFPDNQDLQDFLDVFGGGACSTGTCGDLDFNNDGL